jgi:hypothetical protein
MSSHSKAVPAGTRRAIKPLEMIANIIVSYWARLLRKGLLAKAA